MRLWLDDERDPSIWSPSSLYGIKWTWVKTAREAIEIIKTGKVYEISLDHDLGDDPEGFEPNTGYQVALFIEECAYFGTVKKFKWAVHSANPVGHNNIKVALEHADKYWDGYELLPDFQISDEEI